ncbi:hypothetical protein D3Z58_21675 [Clostridiaceae bacterium]|nr:hypothetical protein [Clostridiaceae bacterium]
MILMASCSHKFGHRICIFPRFWIVNVKMKIIKVLRHQIILLDFFIIFCGQFLKQNGVENNIIQVLPRYSAGIEVKPIEADFLYLASS